MLCLGHFVWHWAISALTLALFILLHSPFFFSWISTSTVFGKLELGPGPAWHMGRDYSFCRAFELTDCQVRGFVFSWFPSSRKYRKNKATQETFLRLMPLNATQSTNHRWFNQWIMETVPEIKYLTPWQAGRLLLALNHLWKGRELSWVEKGLIGWWTESLQAETRSFGTCAQR